MLLAITLPRTDRSASLLSLDRAPQSSGARLATVLRRYAGEQRERVEDVLAIADLHERRQRLAGVVLALRAAVALELELGKSEQRHALPPGELRAGREVGAACQ